MQFSHNLPEFPREIVADGIKQNPVNASRWTGDSCMLIPAQAVVIVRQVRFVKESFMAGRTFSNITDLNIEAVR